MSELKPDHDYLGEVSKLSVSVPEWKPCDGCPFAGEVIEFSVPTWNNQDCTVRTSDPLRSEGDIAVSFVENAGTSAETWSGEATIRLGGNSYGTGDDLEAAETAAYLLKQCSEKEQPPLQGARLRVAGFGFGTLRACGAFYEQANPEGTPTLKRGILNVKDAKD